MPVTVTPDPAALAARASALRRLATKLAECPIDSLPGQAGADTWIGPTADRCREELTIHVEAVHDAIAQLLSRANSLDRLAEQAAAPLGMM